MNIIVCAKQICMTYARTGLDPDRHYLAPEDQIYRVNPYDEWALETALRIKDQRDPVGITILTLGPLIAEEELRRCLAVGADDLCHLDMENEPDPWTRSVLLARSIKELKADLVLCGKESLDKQDGQVPAFIAHHLDMPFVSAIMDLTLEEGDRAIARRSAGRGVRERIECPLPAVFSVDMGFHEPRLPAYEDRLEALSRPIQKRTVPREEIAGKTRPAGTYPPRPRPKPLPAPDSGLEAFDRIDQLLAGSRVEKKGTVLRGDPETQVRGILEFLEKQGFIEAKK